MIKEFTCIICPNGCDIEADIENGRVLFTEGEKCKRGITYIEQELINPQRNIATSIEVMGGHLPLASVRLTAPIPKDRIFDVMEEIKKIKIEAPVSIGQIIICDVLSLNSDVIATKEVNKAENFTVQ